MRALETVFLGFAFSQLVFSMEANATSLTCTREGANNPAFVIDSVTPRYEISVDDTDPEAAHVEGSRDIETKILEDKGALSIAVELGDVTQGGNVLSDEHNLISIYIDKDGNFTEIFDGKPGSGKCTSN